MTNITFSLPKDLFDRMKSHPEIKWTEVVRQSIHNFLDNLEEIEEISSEDLRKRLALEIPPATEEEYKFALKMMKLRDVG